MSNKKQVEKNLKLSSRVASYIMENPDAVKKVPKNSTYVIFSVDDQELNKKNEKMIFSLKNEGKKVIKVFETKNKTNPWNFISL